MSSSTVENYLKALLHLEMGLGDDEVVSVGRLAQALELTPGTVTSMVKRLSAETKLLRYKPRRGVRLTAEGRLEAMRILRRHRVIETFLVNMVGMEGTQVHEEAETLEHAMSDDLVERLDDLLGQPQHDPHGAPIPSSEGSMPHDMRMPLSEAAEGSYRIVAVEGNDRDFLDYSSRNGLRANAEIKLCDLDEAADTRTLVIDDNRVLLGGKAAGRITVCPI